MRPEPHRPGAADSLFRARLSERIERRDPLIRRAGPTGTRTARPRTTADARRSGSTAPFASRGRGGAAALDHDEAPMRAGEQGHPSGCVTPAKILSRGNVRRPACARRARGAADARRVRHAAPISRFLLAEAIPAAVTYRHGVLVNVPQPSRYAVHKLSCAQADRRPAPGARLLIRSEDA
jgi:hypothetical protein